MATPYALTMVYEVSFIFWDVESGIPQEKYSNGTSHATSHGMALLRSFV